MPTGKSAATVSYNAKENALVLEGNLNTECTTWKMKKSGYAAIISPVRYGVLQCLSRHVIQSLSLDD